MPIEVMKLFTRCELEEEGNRGAWQSVDAGGCLV
jgi:hypothetical protein